MRSPRRRGCGGARRLRRSGTARYAAYVLESGQRNLPLSADYDAEDLRTDSGDPCRARSKPAKAYRTVSEIRLGTSVKKESARKPRLKEPGAPLVRSNEWENYELRADSHLRFGPAFIDSHGPSLKRPLEDCLLVRHRARAQATKLLSRRGDMGSQSSVTVIPERM